MEKVQGMIYIWGDGFDQVRGKDGYRGLSLRQVGCAERRALWKACFRPVQ